MREMGFLQELANEICKPNYDTFEICETSLC